jgi:uncharacterized protein YjdB
MRSRLRTLGFLAAALVAAAACSRKVASIDIAPKKLKIYGLERSQRLTARLLDKKGQPLESGAPSWTSSNAAIAQAEPGGRVTSKGAGQATITATYEEVTASVPVEIVDVSTIEIAPPALSLIGPAGTSVPLSYTVRDSKQKAVAIEPSWTSANEKVATVSAQGAVTSVASGTTNIVARVGDVQGASEVSVSLRAIARLELRPATAIARVGDSQRFLVTAYGTDGQAIPEVAAVFKSSNPEVATVDAAGVASGRKAGASIIRVELAGQSAEATLLVN